MRLQAIEYLKISGLVIDFATTPVRTGNSFFGHKLTRRPYRRFLVRRPIYRQLSDMVKFTVWVVVGVELVTTTSIVT